MALRSVIQDRRDYMQNRYKVTISSPRLYKEIELTPEIQRIRIGTDQGCEIRLNKEIFFAPIELTFLHDSNQWTVVCNDYLYLTLGNDIQKYVIRKLTHGSELILHYQSNGYEIFNLSFMLDFDYKMRLYDQKIDINNLSTLHIGSNSNCQIRLKSNYAQNEMISLSKQANKLRITNLHTTIGVYINGKKSSKGDEINSRDFFSIADYSFYFKNGYLYTDQFPEFQLNGLTSNELVCSFKASKYPRFIRNIRIKSKINTEKIEILDPPQEPQEPKGNIVLKLLPAIATLILTVIVRGFMSPSSNSSFIIFSVVSMTIGILTSVFSIISEKRDYKKSVKERIENYNKYIDEKEKNIQQYRKFEKEQLDSIYTDPLKEINKVIKLSGDILDRSIKDDDFLCLRIGTGSILSQRPIAYKKQERFASKDQLISIPADLAHRYRLLEEAPVVIDMKKTPLIGVVGSKKTCYEMLKLMILDITVRHYNKDVDLFLLIAPDEINAFQWARWFPHITNQRVQCRNIVCNQESKNTVFEYLYKELSKRSIEKQIDGPYIVVLVFDDWDINTHPVSQYLSRSEELKCSFIFFEKYKELIPSVCQKMLILDSSQNCGTLYDSKNKDESTRFIYPNVSDADISEVSKVLAPIYCDEVNLENTLTKNYTLYEMFNILSADDLDLESRWASSEIYKSMAAPLGIQAKGEIIYLDLHEKSHGPHGLVAGTTGSGKSEILQTYILSMSTLFHPYEVGFVIIDFKGGGMVNQFKRLPHLTGAITNIDGREINRSLLSIRAELEKRQQLFAKYNVNNINNYIRKYKSGEIVEPLPHLILIVDEFAELKAEQPDFMKELISTARIGRSLGVHLILATQKPSGQVNEQIWSNSRFKLCLKVATKEDSNEVIKSPLAAEIKEPGRAYLQVGNNEVFELFQSAYSGASAQVDDGQNIREFTLYEIDFSGKRTQIYQQKKSKSIRNTMTQLDELVEYICKYCENKKIQSLPNICLPPLKDIINYPNGQNKINNTKLLIPIGIYDDPSHQYQGVAEINLSDENTMIVGSSQTGKTNLLQTIIRYIGTHYQVNEVNIYIMDFASMFLKVFENMAHIGGIVIPGEDERVKNLFRLLSNEIQSRKMQLLDLGVSSYNAYVETGRKDIPRIIVLIDNFAVFREIYGDEYESDFVYLCREGLSYGLSFVITNLTTNGFGYKYLSSFASRLALTCNDSNDYSSMFERCRIEPKNTPGRMLFRKDKVVLEVQSYLSFDGEKEIERTNAIHAFIDKINQNNIDMKAKKIPSVPEVLTYRYIEENYHISTDLMNYPIGLNYETVDITSVSFRQTNELTIVGKNISKNLRVFNALIYSLNYQIFSRPIKMYIIDGVERRLKGMQNLPYVERYTIDYSEVGNIIDALLAELEVRYEEMMDYGLAVNEDKPLLLVIINSIDAIEYISSSKEMINKYQKILKQYRSLKFAFVFASIEDMVLGYNSPELLKRLKDNPNALVTSNLKELKFFNSIPSKTINGTRTLGNTDAYLVKGTDVERIKILDEEGFHDGSESIG